MFQIRNGGVINEFKSFKDALKYHMECGSDKISFTLEDGTKMILCSNTENNTLNVDIQRMIMFNPTQNLQEVFTNENY